MSRPPHHAAQFSGDDADLIATVADFLGGGLVAGQPAVVIATPDHREAIVRQLEARLIDCDHVRRIGNLVLLDAEETLALFMVDGQPNADRFERSVGGLVTQALGGRRHTVLRAYGEMVDLLWRGGQSEAATQLEILWNRLALTHHFALLCGYSMGHFYQPSKARVSPADTHPVESKVIPFEPPRRSA